MNEGAPSKLAAQAARTRAQLIEVALELLAERRFRQMSLDAIAARAGVTKGAIYGHFESKDVLLMAAFFSRPEARPDALDWPEGRDGSPRERLRRLARAVIAKQKGAGPSAAAVGAEFMLYALGVPALKAPVAAMIARSRDALRERLLALFDSDELAMPVESLTMLIGALVPGFMLIGGFVGEALDEAAILAMFEAFAA